MAKKDGVNFGDLITGLEKNNLKMSASVQAQLDSQLKTEKVLTTTKALEVSQTSESIKSAKVDDALVKDIRKGLLEKRGDGLNANTIKLVTTLKEMNNKIPKVPSGGKPSKEQTDGITGLAGGVKTFKGIRERISDFGKGLKDKYGPGNIGNTMLKAVNVGGVFDKRIEQNDFIKQQQKLGSKKGDDALRDDFNKRNEVAKNIQKNEAKFDELKKISGGQSEKDLAKTVGGKELLENREKLAGQFGKYDVRSKFFESADDSSDMDDGRIKAGPKAPAADAEEVANEQAQVQTQQFEILKQIEENTRPAGSADKNGQSKQGGGLLDGLMGSLGGGLMKGFSSLFSPANLLKAFTKVFLPAMLIGSLINGIMDGFKAFKETGSISEALIAGLGGILSFLSFGLFDGETIRNIADSFKGFVDEYIINPVMNLFNTIKDTFNKYITEPLGSVLSSVTGFFSTIKDSIFGWFESFTIPAVGFSVLGKNVKFGPWKPFSDETSVSTSPLSSADQKEMDATEKSLFGNVATLGNVKPANTANAVYDNSGKNKEATMASNKSGNAPAIVSAPTIVNNKTNQQAFVHTPIRNHDNTLNGYLKSRYN